jgi:uncharacterized protein (DUF433 family)
MQLEDFFEFHTEPVEHIRIKGTRIDIDHVIDLYRRHMTPEQIAVYFGCPLEPVQVYATILYYLQNRAAVEDYLARGEQIFQAHYAEYLAKPLSPAAQRIRALKAARNAPESAGQP